MPDVADNCSALFQYPGEFCDADEDGFGNLCDADINQSGDGNAGAVSAFLAALSASPGTPEHLVADLNCSGDANAGDVSPFLDLLSVGGPPGPSGLACRDPFAPPATGVCPSTRTP